MQSWAERFFGPPSPSEPGHLWPRWLLLRALGFIFFSAFYSLTFQIHGLIGPGGILPAATYLESVARATPGLERLWVAPTLLWAGGGDRALTALVAGGLACSVLLTANVWPRLTVALCTLFFLSCVSALQEFSSYQSDGMLLEAGFLSIFFAPRGVFPGLGASDPPSRASLFLLQWEWFRIYFESGVVKLASGDVGWRTLTAMDHYYENGPLPTWLGWYVQQFPHAYHAATALLTLVVELAVVWMLFLPRRFRIACFLIVTPLQLGIIATANYAFLNYLVLALGVLLLDDRALERIGLRTPQATPRAVAPWRIWTTAVALTWVFYATVAPFFSGTLGPLTLPVRALEPFRIANSYGLFAVMTPARYEIEFQGTRDGRTWLVYPFRYKPQDPRVAPGIYAPYQPRFEWNLWFASLGPWRASPWVVLAQMRLLENSPSVLSLFRANPFPHAPPTAVRTVLWQYWFTDPATKRATGQWWKRQRLGLYSGVVVRRANGKIDLVEAP
ncbi:MAG: lipase maturation factor family protein [Chloroflexota bacterium]|nr:lipase maturation factor family protein [Chloroflexota bacterium]